jgi:threonine dehydrogenase-like Zn-dependent dehydrogenase
MDTTKIESEKISVPENVTFSSKCRKDDSKTMMAAQFISKQKIEIGNVSVPIITDPTDALIKVTATTVCGSDLHLYHQEVPKKFIQNAIIGHEAVGIIEDLGSDVQKFKKGDRVVISAVISCGTCDYCKKGEWSCCDSTNQSKEQREMFGHNTAALLGYSDLFGGLDGCQAEYVRVPFADVNVFKIPDGIEDKQALCIADIACTGYHGTQLADVQEGDSVVVFGCGPVGMMAQMWSKQRGAKIVIGIDVDDQRFQFAKEHFGVETINNKEKDPIEEVNKIIPGGPDKVIDCVGFRFPDSIIHKFERVVGLETD